MFKRFQPIPTSRHPEHEYKVTPEQLEHEIQERGLRVVVTSNPCNPTGMLLLVSQHSDFL